MTTQEANTIWTKAYTPAGRQVGITISFESGKLIPAHEVDALLEASGYLASLPGTEPGEDVETMTHVIRCTQHNSDGTTTPCIGLYYENTKLEFARKAYLDTPEQQAAFEAVSGLKIAALPEFPTATLPKRNDKSAARFIVQAPTPFRVVMQPHHYTDDDGNEKTTRKFGRFLDAPSQADSGKAVLNNIIEMATGDTPFTDKETAAQFIAYWENTAQLDTGKLLTILGVSRFSEWQHSINAANERVELKVTELEAVS